MARKITAGIQLELNDQLSPKLQGARIAVEDFAEKTADEAGKVDKTFSPKIKGAGTAAQGLGEKAKGAAEKVKESFSSKLSGAGISLQGFADKAVGVASKINQAFSGMTGTLGTLGVSIGALSAVKSTIDLDNRMARLGLTANASAAQVNELKRQIFETAQMPDIKLDTDSIISALVYCPKQNSK